jgi:oligoendopeptidase F
MQTTWDFSVFGLSATQSEIQIHTDKLLVRAKDFLDTYSNNMNTLSDLAWKDYFDSGEVLSKEVSRVAQFVGLISSDQSNNPEITKLQSYVDVQMSKLQVILIPLGLEIKLLGTQKLTELSQSPTLSGYSNYFIQVANSASHALSQPEETLIATKSISLSSNYMQLFETLGAAQMYEVEVDGTPTEVTEGEVRSWRSDSNPQKRALALELLKGYYSQEEQQIVRGSVYYGIVSDWVNDAKLRGYESSIGARTLSEEMQDHEVATLLTGVTNHYPKYQQFLQLKSQYLGTKKLGIADVFAPFSTTKAEIVWAEGWKLTQDTLAQFDPGIGVFMDELVLNGRIDVYPKKGKQGGAFASYNKYFGQFVKLNYTDDLDSVTTLAHELGHAYHGMISLGQPEDVYHTPLVLAETASTFFELILNHQLMKDKPELRLTILSGMLDDFFSTVVRQVQYVNFENRMHNMVWSGEVFNYDTCNTVWLEEVSKMFGDKVEGFEDYSQYGWSGIPHIYASPFYCYAYAYGLLFALALFNQYKHTKSSKQLIDILSLGGSKTPAQMLEIAGIKDINEMIEGGFAQVAEWLEELKKLV